MNVKAEVQSSGMDSAKLGVALLLVAGAIALFYYFESYSLLLRVVGMLAVFGLSVAIAMQTAVGRRTWEFIGDSKMEVRKVVWPSRQETIQTTLVVFVMVLLMALVLWFFDMALMATMRALTGHGS
jgi:preprotein translocase subunit SecE